MRIAEIRIKGLTGNSGCVWRVTRPVMLEKKS
jgi:hypothetical protein